MSEEVKSGKACVLCHTGTSLKLVNSGYVGRQNVATVNIEDMVNLAA